jgi:hypothetical protein
MSTWYAPFPNIQFSLFGTRFHIDVGDLIYTGENQVDRQNDRRQVELTRPIWHAIFRNRVDPQAHP